MQGYWEEGTGLWKWTYKNLTNISIDKKGNFTSDQHSGQFVMYTDSSSTRKGLKIDNPWTTWLAKGKYEIGIRLNVSPRQYAGNYPEGSTRQLIKDEPAKLDKETLRLMRNEILARYGYKFKEGGEMKKYFSNQTWFYPKHKEVLKFLTQIELVNIRLIKEIESEN